MYLAFLYRMLLNSLEFRCPRALTDHPHNLRTQLDHVRKVCAIIFIPVACFEGASELGVDLAKVLLCDRIQEGRYSDYGIASTDSVPGALQEPTEGYIRLHLCLQATS
jgi:hypothetical protein